MKFDFKILLKKIKIKFFKKSYLKNKISRFDNTIYYSDYIINNLKLYLSVKKLTSLMLVVDFL